MDIERIDPVEARLHVTSDNALRTTVRRSI